MKIECMQFFRVGDDVYAYTRRTGGVKLASINGLASYVLSHLADADADAPLWYVSIGTINTGVAPTPQFSLWTGTKPFKSSDHATEDRPGRKCFTGSLEEAWEFIEPYVRML